MLAVCLFCGIYYHKLIHDARGIQMETRMGDNIRRLRDHRRWTLEELSKISGVGVKYISNIENGARNAGKRTINRLCDAFMVSEKVLRFGDPEWGGEERRLDNLTCLVIEKLSPQPESLKAAVLEMILKYEEELKRSGAQ